MNSETNSALISGANINERVNKMADKKVKVKMIRNSFVNGKEEKKGKELTFDRNDHTWLHLLHANAAVELKEETKEEKKPVKR